MAFQRVSWYERNNTATNWCIGNVSCCLVISTSKSCCKVAKHPAWAWIDANSWMVYIQSTCDPDFGDHILPAFRTVKLHDLQILRQTIAIPSARWNLAQRQQVFGFFGTKPSNKWVILYVLKQLEVLALPY